MIKDDVKSGVSVPGTFKPKRTKTPATPSPQGINPGTQKEVLPKSIEPPTSNFEGVYAYFHAQDVRVYRTDYRDGLVSYFAVKNKQVRHISTYSELALVAWALGENHD
jgi:hypothetical protein